MFLIFLLYAICASTFTISKAALAYSQPFFYVAIRMMIAGLILGVYSGVRAWMGGLSIKIRRADWWLFAQIIIFHIYLTYIFDMSGLKDLTSTESALIYNLSPFVAAIFSYLVFDEYMTSRKWLGLAIGFTSFFPDILAGGHITASFWPKILTLGAVISSAYGWIVMRKLVKEGGYEPALINGIGMFFGGVLALGTSFITESWVPSPVSNWHNFIELTLLIVVVANLLFYNLYGYLLSYYTATFLSFAGFLCPIIAGLLGNFFLNEPFTWQMGFSLVTVSIGLFIFYQEELKQGYITS